MSKLKTNWTLNNAPRIEFPDAELVWDGPKPWPEYKSELLGRLGDPDINPEALSDIDRTALRLALAEQLDNKTIIDNTDLFVQMAHNIRKEIDQDIINDLCKIAEAVKLLK